MTEIVAALSLVIVFCALLIVILRRASHDGIDASQFGCPVIPSSGNTEGPAPERSEEIIGWRTWRLEVVDSQLWLRSAVVAVYWQPGHALEACYLPPPAGAAHGPGIYAAKSEAGAMEALSNWSGSVYGTVALWGAVIEHDSGYRAQYAYPQHLWCKDAETARELSRRYGCESEVSERLSGCAS